MLKQGLQDQFHISHKGHVSDYVLADFRRVDVDVNNRGLGSKGLEVHRYAIVKARPERQQHVTFGYGGEPVLRNVSFTAKAGAGGLHGRRHARRSSRMKSAFVRGFGATAL